MANNYGKLFKQVGNAGMREIGKAYTTIIRNSAIVDKRELTERDIEIRFDILAKWHMILLNECSWATSKVIDELPKILRYVLDGKEYTPPTSNKGWVANEGLIYIPE